MQAAKSNYERDLASKEEQAEESRRKMLNQLRELESQLDEEKKQRVSAQSARKKMEAEIAELEAQVGQAVSQLVTVHFSALLTTFNSSSICSCI